jgi:uncharacterized protein (TIGR00297 family)
MQLAFAALFAAAVALLSWRTRALTRGGSLAAFAVGTLVFWAGAWPYAAVLFAFFIPSTVLSRIGRRRKRGLIDAGKQGSRDAWQVAANGGAAAICAVLATLLHRPAFGAAFAGAFAVASADTWGTEIGTLAKRLPRSIVTWKPLATGLSGGVTVPGTLAEIAGAFAVALPAWALGVSAWWIVAVAGFAGALVDSILGATVQELRYCPQCERACESDPHACGSATSPVRGIRAVNNDTVNACATVAGALIAWCLAQ